MPTYEYYCPACDRIAGQEIRLIARRHDPFDCPGCHGLCELAISRPHTAQWNDKEQFPHLFTHAWPNEKDGDFSFPSREAYEQHIKDIGAYEVGVPHCGRNATRYYRTYRKKAPPASPGRGAW